MNHHRCRLSFPSALYQRLHDHLFPGDLDEHGAVLAAGMAIVDGKYHFLVRDVFPAIDGKDYIEGTHGYRALSAKFIHKHIIYCRDNKLVYLAVHNHGGHGSVGFSQTDMESHERGYPALLDIASGMPVGALVIAEKAIQADIWLPNGERLELEHTNLIGLGFERLYPSQRYRSRTISSAHFDRQILLFGDVGQAALKVARVGIVGLGGVGSLICEYLSRLGVGHLVLADPDTLEVSNYSRVVGATTTDLPGPNGIGALKVDIAARLAQQANPQINIIKIAGDFAERKVAEQFLKCDFIFLAADSMRSRLVFNAMAQQYYIPGIQIGSKITLNANNSTVDAAFSVVRWVIPNIGCLFCNELIDATKLAKEWKTDDERKAQQYGVQMPNPSVITMNAVGAAHAVNDFMFYYLGLSKDRVVPPYAIYNHLTGSVNYIEPRKDRSCPECSYTRASRLGKGSGAMLPYSEGR